jgi:hypothetical protein
MTIASEAGHWYQPDGTPAYETLGKDGGMRKTTLREARKLGLYPGFSNIEAMLNKHQLNSWTAKECIKMAIAMHPEKDVDTIYNAFRDRGGDVMDLGSLIHGCIENHLLEKPYDKTYTPHVTGALDCLAEWCGLDGLKPERSFGHPLGYGGKCDIHKPGFVADFKTKEFEETGLPKAWGNHARQLAAYREGFRMPSARCAIIFVSTAVPGLSHLVEVPEKDLAKGWEVFKCLLAVWQAENNYNPNGAHQDAFT